MSEAAEIARLVSHYVTAEGFGVEQQTPWNATLVRGSRTNHLLHMILTVLTAGLWLPVWLVAWLWVRQTRVTIWVDEDGDIRQEVTRHR